MPIPRFFIRSPKAASYLAPDRSSAHPGRADEAWLGAYRSAVLPALRAFWPAELKGLEKLPARDALIVANHSGLGVVECLWLPELWATHVGLDRPLAAMAHSSLFRLPGAGTLLRAVGAVEATRSAARRARDTGASLLLFPGGDHESMRPLWRAREVDFAGRVGFIKLARELGLTLVPMAITGSHVTIPLLGFSKRLARATGLPKVGVHRAPLPVSSIAGAAAYLAASRGSLLGRGAVAAAIFAGLAPIPWVPSRIGFEVLDPLDPRELAEDDAQVYRRVTRAIARALDPLTRSEAPTRSPTRAR